MNVFYAVLLLVLATIVANTLYPYFPLIPQAFYQIFAGGLLSLVPLYNHFVLEPEVFMLLIIAPLMFYDGSNADGKALRRNIGSILSMAVVLAILTVILMGYVSHAMIASIPLALAFALAFSSRPADREWVFFQGTVSYKVRVASRLLINESRALMSAALDGFGIVLGPQDFLRTALASGELVRVLPEFEAPSRSMHLVYTANRQRTAKLRCFVETVLGRFGPV